MLLSYPLCPLSRLSIHFSSHCFDCCLQVMCWLLLVVYPLATASSASASAFASSTSSLAHYCCWPTYVWHIVNVVLVLASSMRLAIYHDSATAIALLRLLLSSPPFNPFTQASILLRSAFGCAYEHINSLSPFKGSLHRPPQSSVPAPP